MENIRSQMRKNLAKNKMNKLSIGSYVLNIVENYFEKKYEISGYIKNNILFVKVNPVMAKSNVFLQKNKLLTVINKKIEDFGWEYIIQDIIIR